MTAPVKEKKAKKTEYFKGVKHEFKKIVWPTKKELINYTSVVLFVTALVAAVVWVLDLGFSQAITSIIK